VDITAGGDFLGFFDQKISYKHVSDFGRLRGYDIIILFVMYYYIYVNNKAIFPTLKCKENSFQVLRMKF